MIRAVAEQVEDEEHRTALRHQAAMVFRGRAGLLELDDQRIVSERYESLLDVLGEGDVSQTDE